MDLYAILQVDRQADLDVIRAAYRVLARRHHPDHGGDPRRMAAVNEAWATLSDKMKRARYDAQLRRMAAAATVANPFEGPVYRPAQQPVMRQASTAPRPSAAASSATAGSANASGRPSATGTAPSFGSAASGPAASRNVPEPGVLDFGRYAGWSLTELSRHDPDYLLWLERTPIGRPLRSEIQRVLEIQRRPQVATMAAAAGGGSDRRPASRWFR